MATEILGFVSVMLLVIGMVRLMAKIEEERRHRSVSNIRWSGAFKRLMQKLDLAESECQMLREKVDLQKDIYRQALILMAENAAEGGLCELCGLEPSRSCESCHRIFREPS